MRKRRPPVAPETASRRQLFAESSPLSRKAATAPPIGWSGTELSAGVFTSADPGNHANLTMEQWLGDTATTGIGEQMLTDPDIAASWREWVEWAKNGNWDVDPADQDDDVSRMQAEFIRRNLWELSETRWAHILENAMGQLVHGCAMAEPAYRWDSGDRTPLFEMIKEPGRLPKWEPTGKFDTGHVVLDDLAARLPRSIQRFHQDPETGKFGGIYQHARMDDTVKNNKMGEIFVPSDRLVLWTHQPTGNHWAGTGLFRPAYFIWRARQTLLRTGVISFERFGVGVPVATVSDKIADMGLSKGDLTAAWNDAMKQLAKYRGGAQAWLALAPGLTVDIKEGQFSGARGILDLYNALTIGIHTIGGTHHLIQGSQKVGTQSLVTEQSADFRSTIMPTLRDVADVLNRSVVRQLIDLNWSGVHGYPEIKPGDLETVDLRKALEAYEIGARSGGIVRQAEDNEFFRDLGGWPAPTEASGEDTDTVPPAVDEAQPDDDVEPAGDEEKHEEDAKPDTMAEACQCGCQGVEILAEPAPMFDVDTSPAMRVRMLAESQHDARASRIGREDIVKRTSIQIHALLGPAVMDPYLKKIQPMLDAGDATAISKVPLPGKAAIQRRLVRDYQDAREMGRYEVKREIKRGKDEDVQEQLAAALAEMRAGQELFAENPSGMTNAIDDLGRDPKEVLRRLMLAASTTTDDILAGLNSATNNYLQQTPVAEWSPTAIKQRALAVVTPRTISKDVTQDVNTTYTAGRAEQGRIEGAGIVVYTVNPEIGINGPHVVCEECQATADSDDNPALVGSAAEERLFTPNPRCLSTLSGVNTCWCNGIYLTTTDTEAAARAAGLA